MMMSFARIAEQSYNNSSDMSVFDSGDIIMSENPTSKRLTMQETDMRFDLKVPKELAEGLVANGLSPIDIARRYGCSAATVYAYLKKWGIDWSTNVKHRLEDACSREQLVYLMGVMGLSQNQIAAKYGFTSQVVRRLIRKYEIQLDPRAKYISRANTRLAQRYMFSREQRSIVVGSALGDGHLRVPAGGVNAQLQFGHCVKQRGYLEWKLRMLGVFATGHIYDDVARNACRAVTICHPEFTWAFELFYSAGLKGIPRTIGELLDPLALAVWYMDDGYTTRYSSTLHTNAFSVLDHELLLGTPILSNLKARCGRVTSNGKIYPTIVFYGDNHRELHRLLDPLILDLFGYKRHSGSSETIREAPSDIEG